MSKPSNKYLMVYAEREHGPGNFTFSRNAEGTIWIRKNGSVVEVLNPLSKHHPYCEMNTSRFPKGCDCNEIYTHQAKEDIAEAMERGEL